MCWSAASAGRVSWLAWLIRVTPVSEERHHAVNDQPVSGISFHTTKSNGVVVEMGHSHVLGIGFIVLRVLFELSIVSPGAAMRWHSTVLHCNLAAQWRASVFEGLLYCTFLSWFFTESNNPNTPRNSMFSLLFATGVSYFQHNSFSTAALKRAWNLWQGQCMTVPERG